MNDQNKRESYFSEKRVKVRDSQRDHVVIGSDDGPINVLIGRNRLLIRPKWVIWINHKRKKNNLRNYSKSGTQRETTWTKPHGQRETTRPKVTTDENFFNWPKSITHTPEMSNMNQSQKRKKIFLRKYSKPASQREKTHGQKRKPKKFSKSEIQKIIAEDTDTETETESEEPEEQSLNQIFGLGLVEFFPNFWRWHRLKN